MVHAAQLRLQFQPAKLATNVGLAFHLAKRDFSPAHAGVRFKELDGNSGRRCGPDSPRGRRCPGVP